MSAPVPGSRQSAAVKPRHHRAALDTIPGPVAELPDGTVIAAAGEAYPIAQGRSFRWTEQGYQVAR